MAQRGLHVAGDDAFRPHTNLRHGFRVALVLRIPLVDGAGFLAAAGQFCGTEALRPCATGVAIDQRTERCKEGNANFCQLKINAQHQPSGMFSNTGKHNLLITNLSELRKPPEIMRKQCKALPRPPPNPRNTKAPLSRGFRMNFGGKPGIRTLGTLLTFAGFQDRCIQPLCQFPVLQMNHRQRAIGKHPG